MKIGIMAPQESGKTSYLVGLYGTLVHIKSLEPTSEHGLNYEWMDKAQQAVMEGQFETLLNGRLGKARFPEKTYEIYHHRVRVGHKREHVFGEIEFIDFPGEVLKGKENKVKPADLERALTECMGFIVLLDANYLKVSAISGRLGAAVGHIDAMLRKTIEKRAYGSIGVPVSLCISKYDCLSPQEEESAYHKARAMFPRFFEMNHEHPLFLTGVSLGDDIENGGEFEPFQLENALQFCLSFCAFQARDLQHEQASRADGWEYEARGKARELRNDIEEREGSIFTAFGRWWTTGKTVSDIREEADSHSSRADRYEEQADTHRSRASEFIKIGEEAARHIREDVDNPGMIYYKGKEHHFKETVGTGFPLEAIEERATS